MERIETFHATIASGGIQDDIDRIETPGEATGMVRSGQGLQKQRDKCPAVVQRKRDHNHNMLSLGAGAAGSCQYNSEIITAIFAELPKPKQVSRNVSECSATLHIGSGSIMFHQELSAELLKTIVEALRSC